MHDYVSASACSVVLADQLAVRAAVSAFLGRYRGQTRVHTDSGLRVFLPWCAAHDLDPLAAVRVDIERYVRWLQEVRLYQPSTVSRRLSVVVGLYRVCAIDMILEHSPATTSVALRCRPSRRSSARGTYSSKL